MANYNNYNYVCNVPAATFFRHKKKSPQNVANKLPLPQSIQFGKRFVIFEKNNPPNHKTQMEDGTERKPLKKIERRRRQLIGRKMHILTKPLDLCIIKWPSLNFGTWQHTTGIRTKKAGLITNYYLVIFR
jgi:hypothetical protein